MLDIALPSISPREKLLVTLASLSLALYILGAYITAPAWQNIGANRLYYSDLVKKKAALSAYDGAARGVEESITLEESKNRYLATVIAKTEHNLLGVGHEKNLIALLEKISSETEISLTSFKSSDTVVAQKLEGKGTLEYRQREITIGLVGGYYSLGGLLERLSSLPLRLETIDIRNTEENGVLVGEITLKIFSL